jgi:hypothetical protein
MSKEYFYKILNYILGRYKTDVTQQVNTHENFFKGHIEIGTEVWEGDHLFISFKGIIRGAKASNVELIINLPSHILTINARSEEALKLIEDNLIKLK